MTTISIAMATYNGARFIAEQIDSIVASASVVPEIELEFIISDDGSSDETLDIIRSYINKGMKISLLQGPQQGVIRNFEYAISHCTGEYVFLSDQDDVWIKSKIATILKLFQMYPSVSCIVHNVAIVDGSLNKTGETFFDIRKSRSGLLWNLYKNRYMGSAMAIRRNVLNKALPFPNGIPMHDQWIGLINELYGKSMFIDDVLGLYRRYGENVSSYEVHGNVKQMISDRCSLIANLVKRHVQNGQ